MKILSTIISMLKFVLGLVLPEEHIKVSAHTESLLEEMKSIYDNRAAIADGTYKLNLTGHPEIDALIQMAAGFVKKYFATNPELVETEMTELLTQMQPIVDEFVGATKTQAAPAPADAQENAPPAPAKGSSIFLDTALSMIGNILSQSKSESSQSMQVVDTNAEQAKAAIQNHIDATELNPSMPGTILKQGITFLDNIITHVGGEANITPTHQNIISSAAVAKDAILSHINTAIKK